MRAGLLALLAASACSPEPRREFPVGIVEPVSPRVAAEARRLGLELAGEAPRGAATVSAAFPVKGGSGEVILNFEKLRFLTARAITEGSAGIFFRLPSAPAGRDLLDYIEEWQALDRVSRELLSIQPILRGGSPSSAPFAIPAGIKSRAWAYHGRLYVLLLNDSGGSLPVGENSLADWRALFAVRSDARQFIAPCGNTSCLPPEGVLWLEGRLFQKVPP